MPNKYSLFSVNTTLDKIKNDKKVTNNTLKRAKIHTTRINELCTKWYTKNLGSGEKL